MLPELIFQLTSCLSFWKSVSS